MRVIAKLWCGDDGDGGVFMTVTKIMVVEVGGDGGNENNIVNLLLNWCFILEK